MGGRFLVVWPVATALILAIALTACAPSSEMPANEAAEALAEVVDNGRTCDLSETATDLGLTCSSYSWPGLSTVTVAETVPDIIERLRESSADETDKLVAEIQHALALELPADSPLFHEWLAEFVRWTAVGGDEPPYPSQLGPIGEPTG